MTMSAEILRYVLVDRDDNEGDYEYTTLAEAKADAGDDHAVVERTYTYDDSELVWTPDGSDTWPPKAEAHVTPRPDCDGHVLASLTSTVNECSPGAHSVDRRDAVRLRRVRANRGRAGVGDRERARGG